MPVKPKRRSRSARPMFSSLTVRIWAPGAVGGDAMFVALQDYLADPDSMMEILETLEDAADAAY